MEKGAYKREDKDSTRIKPAGIPLEARLSVYAGEPMRLTVSPSGRLSENQSIQSAASRLAPETVGRASGTDNIIRLEGDIAEKATNRPMSKDDFIKQLNKTGETDFCFETVSVETDGDSFVRVSALNDLRRRALDMMKERLTDGYKRSM